MAPGEAGTTVRRSGIGGLIAVALLGLPVWLLLIVHETVKAGVRANPHLGANDIPTLTAAYDILTVLGNIIHGSVSAAAILVAAVATWWGMPPRRRVYLWALVALVVACDWYLTDVMKMRM
jgi:hypothetical protein